MVLLSAVQSSNALIPSSLPPGLVALFVGGTSGIGEATLKQFAKYARKPRIYFIGRSRTAADRIVQECNALNPGGKYTFIEADVSLIRNVDVVCEDIKTRENALNILCLSQGGAHLDRSETLEHLHLLAALTYYSRMRFITNLLPLLQRAPHLRRVLTVAGGGLEGPLDPTDFPALRLSLFALRKHLVTLKSLGLEAVARQASDVAFVHDYPGTVDTALATRIPGIRGVALRAYIRFLGRWVCVPIEESGARHLYLLTSARYPPLRQGAGAEVGVELGDGAEVAQGTNGAVGSGVYSVGWDGESLAPAAQQVLAGYRAQGMVDEVWRHTEGEFERIAGPERGL